MGVFQQVFLYQPFKISFFHRLFQFFKGLVCFNMHKRRFPVIEPAVQRLEPQHQPSRIRTEIRFPVSEFKIIDCRRKGLFIQPLLNLFLKSIFNHRYKFFFPGFFCIFSYHGKIGLVNSILRSAVYILSDPSVNQGLLYHCPGRGTKHIIQHVHGNIKLFIQTGAHGNVVGKVCAFSRIFILHHRVFPGQLPAPFKRLLQADFRVHCKKVKVRQILFIQKNKVFRRIKVSV